VVSEHGEEFDAVIEQRLVGLLEFQSIVLWCGRSFVDVVAGHQDKVVAESLTISDHLRGYRILLS
jgi:hypothetical protein